MEELRSVACEVVVKRVAEALIEATHHLPRDVIEALEVAESGESSPIGKTALGFLLQNCQVSGERDIPVCQDTGMVVAFAKIGHRVVIDGGSLNEAIQRGVRLAYTTGGLRCSVVRDPLFHRENTQDNTPAVIHVEMIEGDTLEISLMPKGFGSENMARLTMLTPSATEEDIIGFVEETVRLAGSNPCPPVIVGVGLGSDFEGAALLAKQSLLRHIGEEHPNAEYAALEAKILKRVNALGIGPAGFGGGTTALAVHICVAPTHIAGLPCAVNLNCYAARHTTITI